MSNFQVVGTAQNFSVSIATNLGGFSQSERPGHRFSDYFTAIVSSPVTASVGFVQKMNSSWARVETTKVTTTIKTPDNAEILDINYESSPYLREAFYGVNHGETVNIGGPDSVGDSPALMSRLFAFDRSLGIVQTIKYRVFLTTYIDFKPSNGIHVFVAKADWSVGGSATFNGHDSPTLANPDEWTVFNMNPTDWTVDGSSFLALPKWDTNWPLIKDQNTTVEFAPDVGWIDYSPDDVVFVAAKGKKVSRKYHTNANFIN